jgi:hypothetical protein
MLSALSRGWPTGTASSASSPFSDAPSAAAACDPTGHEPEGVIICSFVDTGSLDQPEGGRPGQQGYEGAEHWRGPRLDELVQSLINLFQPGHYRGNS